MGRSTPDHKGGAAEQVGLCISEALLGRRSRVNFAMLRGGTRRKAVGCNRRVGGPAVLFRTLVLILFSQRGLPWRRFL